MFKTTKLYENSSFLDFLRETPEQIQHRTILLNKIDSLTQLLSLI